MPTNSVPTIFSQRRRILRSERQSRLTRADTAADWLANAMSEDIVERLSFMRFEPQSALLLGSGLEDVGSYLRERECDVVHLSEQNEEEPLADGPFDLIVSVNRLDTVNDLPGALLHHRAALNEGGLMIASFLGAGSLSVLRQIMLAADGERPAARLHPQIDNRAAAALMQRAGFRQQVVDDHRLSVSYRNLDRLVADLREQGLTSVLADAPPPVGKAGLARARAKFEELADERGRVLETFEILTLTGWR